MQFSLIALLAVLTAVSAAPATLHARTCNLKKCFLDLAPSGVTCTAATAQAEADPISDAACFLAVAKVVEEFPASCNGCGAKLGISGAIDKAKDVIKHIFTP
ncbi:hypothetical protein FB451DRAFT_1552351 [Mycena latifolia]|nr:hypothetical protein FB451DRAFT_1552351 [Mycena latifolia]